MVKVGDKVRVLESDANGSREDVGAILTVTKIYGDGFDTTSTEPKYSGWAFSKQDIGRCLELVVSETIIEEYEQNPKLDTNPVKGPKKGLRYNTDKLRWRNFPMFLMKPLIEVAQYGESKYTAFNFLDGQTTLDSLDSLKRHLELFESPYDPDADHESKINHLAHVAWNALVALHMLKTRPDLDDRYKLPEQKSDKQ